MSDRLLFGRHLPGSWELLTIGDVADIVGGSTPKSKEPRYWGGDIPWLGVADLTGYTAKRISHGERSITEAGYESCPTQMLPKESVIFSSRAPIGYVAIADGPLCTSQGFKSLVLPASVSSDYVYWWMKAARPLADALASGTTFKEISGKGTARVPFPLPPRAEQDQIVEAVELAMAAVDAGTRDVQMASQTAVALRQRLVDSAAAVDVCDRKKLKDCLAAPLINGRSVPTADSGFPVLRLTAIKNGMIDADESKVGAWTADDARPYLISDGDFLVARGNGSLALVGRGGLVCQDPPEVAFPDTAIRIQIDDTAMSRDYLSLIWDSDLIRQQIERQARTTAGIHKINQSILGALDVPVPSIEEQQRRVGTTRARLAEIDQLKAAGVEAGASADSLRRSILHHAFTGQLVPQDPSDEPATGLLERIKVEKAEREAERKAAKGRKKGKRSR